MAPHRAVAARLLAAVLLLSCNGSRPSAAPPPASAPSTAAPIGSTPAVSSAPAPPPVSVPAPTIAGPPLEAVAWSPGGRWLAAFCLLACAAREGAPDGVPVPLQLLDLREGRLHGTLLLAQRAPGGGASAFFSPDDAFLATVHGSGALRLFRIADGKLVRELHLAAVYDAVAFSPDASSVVLGSVLGSTALIGLPQGKIVRADAVPNPFATAVPVRFTWSPAGDRLVVTRDGSELRDGRTGARIAVHPGGRGAEDSLVHFGAGGRDVLFAACDGLVQRLRADTFAVVETLRAAGESTPCALAVDRGGARLLRATDAGIELFDVASRSSRSLASPGSPDGVPVVSRDGRWIVEPRFGAAGGGSPRAAVHVLDASGGAPPRLLEGETVIGWSAGGELYRAGPGWIAAWSPSGGEVFRAAFEAPIQGPQMSPDGRFVAVADGQLVLVRTSDHAILRVSIAEENGALRLVPDPATVAAFLR